MKRVPLPDLIRFGVRLLVCRGVPLKNARYLSALIAETEAFRQSTHGVIHFKALDDALGKEVDPARKPRVVNQTAAAALLDGRRVIGAIALKKAKELALQSAKKYGIGFAAVRNSSWIGGVGMHLAGLAQEGFLAMAYAQAPGCKDCAPVGGMDARFSTNPLSIAFPGPRHPVLADFSTASLSYAATLAMIKNRKKTPVPRFLDKNGRPTCDPAVFRDGGTLLFAGGDFDGHKAYGLSLFIEALTVMSGGSANHPSPESPQSFGLLVLNPDYFAGKNYFNKEIRRFIRYVKSSRVRPGWDKVRLPGERGFAALEECRKKGVPMSDEKLETLRALADKNGIPLGF